MILKSLLGCALSICVCLAPVSQRCKCFFFDAGVEKSLASPFKTLLARPERDRARMFIGLTFPADFPCHRSAKATAQRVSSFVIGAPITRA